ncbi:hypothetical protein [Vibrio phage XZ1]|uniref:Uncharacterized protein n=1 Tax=Vibrio phage ValKK3 TaxID=1610855 RepID=A0A0D4DBV8_9CAUD|nr:hypothetical protein AVU32_gp306 [Vibrio phage ValKK3]ALP47550.1 hypothetical protein phiST2_0204 [Vibrio phage phi-ST2]QBX06135.1 hypothetical protein Va3_181 [Vibrio phage Va3]QNJ54760.1 hypothetical protein vBValMR10Z_220 [Vibrio phage vB_ValM_R10Z]QNJ55147.1 hypothetical protein vBValMR11Z_221 [Vibrio phage vB_ValM_R11Z]UOL51194.1 hypothetical protein [Vibrio phage XZ1]
MEFLLPVLPIIGMFVILLLILAVSFFMAKIFKLDIKLPYGKIITAALLLTVAASGFKIATSPITRPTMNEAVNDTAKYKVDEFTELEAPVLEDKSFKAEDVDVTTLDSEERIKNHTKNL